MENEKQESERAVLTGALQEFLPGSWLFTDQTHRQTQASPWDKLVSIHHLLLPLLLFPLHLGNMNQRQIHAA